MTFGLIPMDRNDLVVQPSTYQMARGDREIFGFDAKEPITDGTVSVVRLRPHALDPVAAPEVIDGPRALSGQIVNIAIHNLTPGAIYRLVVTFTNVEGRRWSRMLYIQCVA